MPILDGCKIRIGAHVWQARSVAQRIDEYRWLEVALVGRPFYTVLLKMALSARTRDAVDALEWWLAKPGHEDGDVIEVD